MAEREDKSVKAPVEEERQATEETEAEEEAKSEGTNEDDAAEKALAAANDAARTVRNVYITFLLLGTYIGIIIASTTDEQLLRGSTVKLPLLDVDLPILGFYILVSWLLVLMHFNLLLQFYLLAHKLRDFAQRAGECSNAQSTALRTRLYGFPIAHVLAGPRHPRLVRMLLSLVVWITLSVLPLLLLLWAQVAFLPYHDPQITWAHRAAIILDVLFLAGFWGLIVSQRPPGAWYRERVGPIVAWLVWFWLVLAASLLVATIPEEPWESQLLRYASSDWIFEPQETCPHPRSLHLTHFLFDRERAWFRRNLVLREKILTANLLEAKLANDLREGNDKEREAALREVLGLDLRDRDLRRADFYRAILPKADLRGAQLDCAQMQESQLPSARMDPLLTASGPKTTSLQQVGFQEANLRGANLEEAQLQGTTLVGARLQGANLNKARLQEANLTEARLQGANLTKARLQGAHLTEARLQGARLTEARLEGAVLWEAKLQRAFLIGANLQGAKLYGAQLQGAQLIGGAQLQGTFLEEAQLQGADLFGARLQGARLHSAKLQGAYLFDAQLQGAELTLADLRGAMLRRVQLQGADLRSANLQGAYLRETAITGAVFDGARLDLAYLAELHRRTMTKKAVKDLIATLAQYIPHAPRLAQIEARLSSGGFGAEALKKIESAKQCWSDEPELFPDCLGPGEKETYREVVTPVLVQLACEGPYIAEGVALRATWPINDRGLATALLNAECPVVKSLPESWKDRLHKVTSPRPPP